MFNGFVDKLRDKSQKRKAGQELVRAMKNGDLGAISSALEKGSDLQGIEASFDLPCMPYPESYEVRGALEIAVELNLPISVFRLLLDAGAAPQNPGQPILGVHQIDRPDGEEIVALVKGADEARRQSSCLDANTPTAKRAHSIRRF